MAAERRLRPVLMTTLVAMLGLLPAALSHGIGSRDAEAAGHRGHRRLADPGAAAAPAAAAAAGAGPPQRERAGETGRHPNRARRGNRGGRRAEQEDTCDGDGAVGSPGRHGPWRVGGWRCWWRWRASSPGAARAACAHFQAANPAAGAAISLPERLMLDDALRLLREHGLDLLMAEAAIESVGGRSWPPPGRSPIRTSAAGSLWILFADHLSSRTWVGSSASGTPTGSKMCCMASGFLRRQEVARRWRRRRCRGPTRNEPWSRQWPSFTPRLLQPSAVAFSHDVQRFDGEERLPDRDPLSTPVRSPRLRPTRSTS